METKNTHFAGEFRIAADHPALAGHFPGNPLVPGVVLLDHAQALIANEARVNGISRVKFTGFVRPGETVRVVTTRRTRGLAFRCEVDGRAVVQGEFTLASGA